MSETNSPTQPLVMIVDDHVESLETYTLFFETQGFATCGTTTALHAIEMAVKRRPNVVLTDVAMPHVDGFTILRTLKEHPLTTSIPVVMITGRMDRETRERAERGGCHAFFTKPCNPLQLADTLRDAIKDTAQTPAATRTIN
jgi:CheY-like chemotaxis protein